MIDYPSEIKPLEGDLSDAQIAEHLNAKTAYAMQSSEVKYILQDTGACLLDPVQVDRRSGSLISYYENLPDGDAKDLIAFFLGRIYGNQPVATDQYPRSIQFASVEASLPADLQAVSAKLVESAGGRPHSGVTEQDVIDAKAAWEQAEADRIAEEEARAEAERIAREEKKAEEERQRQIDEKLQANDAQFWSLYNQHVAPLKDAREVAGWQAAIQAMADGWSE
jgi:hypothetical protein